MVVMVTVVVVAAVVVSISYHPVGHLTIYFFNFHRFNGGGGGGGVGGGGGACGGGGGGSGIGGGHSISWDDPLLTCLQIVRFWCLLKRRNGPTDGRTYIQTLL